MSWYGDSRVWYTALVAFVAAARLAELARSRRNATRLLARGARESGAGHYPVLVTVHAGILVACPIEVWLLRRPFFPVLASCMGLLLVATMALRYWVIATLAERWTTRVIVPPSGSLVSAGPYQFVRHPNYLAVALELPAMALVHTAWISAIAFGLANALVLLVRIRVEDEALAPHRSSPSRSG